MRDVFEDGNNEYGDIDVDFGLVKRADDVMEAFERKHEILGEFGEELLVEFVRGRVRDGLRKSERQCHEASEQFGFGGVRERLLARVDHLLGFRARVLSVRSWKNLLIKIVIILTLCFYLCSNERSPSSRIIGLIRSPLGRTKKKKIKQRCICGRSSGTKCISPRF